EYIAAIPAMQENEVVSVLVIKRMPFMAFNRENLTSISILLEYFSIEIRNKNILSVHDEISIVPDEQFRFEYARLKHLFKKYKVDSILLVLRIDNELQATRIYEKIVKMLRSLDMVSMVEQNDLYYVTLLFPLHDKAAALGYLNRLLNSLNEEKDKEFNYMTFNLSQTELLNKYLREDYGK
ncbi:MAG: PelD GGDEF domain-containing protein, partial [Campylobacterota bacterium]|nr:PelD GGDEF domain-containing protein [Campylobacterota bacterium]